MNYKIFKSRILSSIFMLSIFFIFFFFFNEYLNILFFIIYIIIFIEIFIYFKISRYRIIIYSYLLFSLIFMQLYFINYFDLNEFIFLILIITFFDSFSYFFGINFGKKKIFKIISPKKTYVGIIGGATSAIICIIIFNYYFQLYNLPLCIILTILYIILSFIGDVIESIFKRLASIKNSSNFIPGHGGFFDRFDSLIMCSYGLICYNYFF